MEKKEIVKFENGELQLDVAISAEDDTAWLSQEDMGLLFGKNKSTISRHIANIFNVILGEVSTFSGDKQGGDESYLMTANSS